MSLGWAARLALKRLLSQWRTLLTVIVGTLLACAVGALIPLYTAAVAQVGLVEQFSRLPLESIHIAGNLSLIPRQTALGANVPRYDDRFRALVDQHLSAPFPKWVSGVYAFGETSVLDFSPPIGSTDTTANWGAARAYLGYYQDWQNRVRLVSGQFPPEDAAAPTAPDVDIEIVIPFEAQSLLNLNIGDVLILDQGGAKGGWETSRNIRAQVVGVAEPLPAADPYYMPAAPLRFGALRGEYAAELSILTTRAAFERVAGEFIPDTPSRIGWRVLFDHTQISVSRLPEARTALLNFENDLKAQLSLEGELNLGLVYATRLIAFTQRNGEIVDDGEILAFERSIRSLDAPFGLLLLQIGALVLFFLMVTAALVRRGERREIAMLQSRGAADRSVTITRGLEALGICVFAVLTAPFVAQRLLILITPFFANYPNLPLVITPTVFAYSAAAGVGAFGALISTLRPVLRLPLISAGGSAMRSHQQAWWQRYYLDVALAVLGIAALLRLVNRDTPLFTTATGGSATDPFLLLAPGLLFLGIGSVLLRLFPLIAGGVSRLLSAGRGLLGSLATWQLSREPIHYGRITFLLALAVGIGWFATSFRATVDRSQNDQAQYRVGTDIRYQERDQRLNVFRARDLEAYTDLPGVEAASVGVRRENVNLQSNPGAAALLGTILGVDPTAFRDTLHWREDLGTVPVPEEVPLPQRGEVLPFTPRQLQFWARFDVLGGFGSHIPDIDRLTNRVRFGVRLLDASGAWITVPFQLAEIEYISTGVEQPGLGGGGGFTTNGWARFEADLSRLSYQPIAPLRLVSFYWSHRGRSAQGERFLRLTLADLRGLDPQGISQALSLFKRETWSFAYDSGAFSEGQVVPASPERHGEGLTIGWDQQAESARMGILLNYPPLTEIPMIASQSLVERLRLQPGQRLSVRNLEGSTVEFRLVESTSYYPSLYDAVYTQDQWLDQGDRQAFVVVPHGPLLYTLNRRPSVALYADEVWLKTGAETSPTAVIEGLRTADAAPIKVMTLPGEIENLQTDPLSRGLLGLMLLAFILAMALSVVGLVTYAALTASNRRSEFGVLRSLGLPSAGVIGQLALEQGFVIVLGGLLGGALGAVLSSQVVPRLAQDASGVQITPPFIVQVETAALLQYGGVLLIVIALVISLSLLLVRGLSLSQTLRLGED